MTYAAYSSDEASSYFGIISSGLPTPASAQSFIPAQPTAGAVVLGSCSATSTLSDGLVTADCSTVFATSETGSRTAGSNAASNTASSAASSATGSASQASGLDRWVPVSLMLMAGIVAAMTILL